MSKEEEEEVDDKDSSTVCKIAGYEILADSKQYIVKAPKKDTSATSVVLGFFKDLAGCITEIREQEMRKKVIKSKTLEIVIEKLVEFDREFAKLLIPLKKLEDK